jgi:hypothetical protein
MGTIRPVYFCVILNLWCAASACAQPLVESINPIIGASTSAQYGEGKTFPDAATPFGLVQLSPDTITGGDNGLSISELKGMMEWKSSTICQRKIEQLQTRTICKPSQSLSQNPRALSKPGFWQVCGNRTKHFSSNLSEKMIQQIQAELQKFKNQNQTN